MPDTITLLKSNPLLPAEDFEAMRKEGIHIIEQTGSEIWTEYNNSDPGITLLEATIYAITDISYRTGFEIKDLLSPEKLEDDTWKQVFYTARQIYHNSPLTLQDYRKVIIDVKGVRNAWIEPSKEYEVPVWIDYNAVQESESHDCGCSDDASMPCFGKLGLNPQDESVYKETWDKRKKEIIKLLTDINTKTEEFDKQIDALKDELNAGGGGDPEEIKKKIKEVKKNRKEYELTIADKRHDLIRELHLVSREALPSKIVEMEGLYNVMIEYEEDVHDDNRRNDVRQQVMGRLTKNRNLCEDFLSLNAVEYEDFGIGGFFVLEEYADPDIVLSEIFFTIFKYFTPSIRFYSVPQLLEKEYAPGRKYTVDMIFEGPPLKHGFIDNNDLDKTDLFRDIRLSDLINEISDINGIKAITYLHLPFNGFDNDNDRSWFNRWVNYLKQQRKLARIQPKQSSIIFCKERQTITYNTGAAQDRPLDHVLKLFKDLKTLERKYKLDLEPAERDLPVPVGENMELTDYYPVTYSLPACYGTAENKELSYSVSEERKVQVLQLRGYMLFFEQILSDYLVQLSNLRQLFTFDDSVTHTYNTSVLKDLEDLKLLLIDHQDRGPRDCDQVIRDFQHVLQNLVETPELFLRRRNKFLNHMLARFSEDTSEYEEIMRWLMPQKAEELFVKNKINLLKNGEYYKISTGRSRGFDYSQQHCWDTGNVSGTERRVSRLLGFDKVNRRDLAPTFLLSEPVMDRSNPSKPRQKTNKKGKPLSIIRLTDPGDPETTLLTSVEVKDGCCVEELMMQIVNFGDNRRYFRILDEAHDHRRRATARQGNYWFELYDGTDFLSAALLATSARFDTSEERDKTLRRIIQIITMINGNEGLHLVEHILLRPRVDIVYDEADKHVPVELLDVCLDVCDLGKGLGDGTEMPRYRIKVTRIPNEKCFDKMPWILHYLKSKKGSKKIDTPFLFQHVFIDDRDPLPLKFGRYEQMTARIRELREFGSEYDNYEIVNNQESDGSLLKYGFLIRRGKGGQILAQSLFEYNKKDPTTKKLVEDDIEIEINNLIRYFGFQLDLYCEENPCDNNEDPYSFRATVVLPCWPKRFRDAGFRNLVEKTLHAESPSHVALKIVWVGMEEMRAFEKVYQPWICELAEKYIPAYETVNPLVEKINHLRPCGCCKDECH